MELIKKNLDLIGLFALSGYVIFLLFAVLDEKLGWETLVDLF